MGTALAVRIDAASFMSDERMHKRWDVVDEPTHQDWPTPVIGNSHILPSVIDRDMAWTIPQSLDSGQDIKFLIQSNQ